MVQVDISQLSAECNAWREQLRIYRDEFTKDENRIRQVAGRPLSKDQLQEVEHLHNQFHIQLINIHDLKQAIKTYDRKLAIGASEHNGAPDVINSTYESLQEQFRSLEQTLQDLRNEFNGFLSRTS